MATEIQCTPAERQSPVFVTRPRRSSCRLVAKVALSSAACVIFFCYFQFLGVIFDGDHDSEVPRSPRAHLDTVLRNLSSHLTALFSWPKPGTTATKRSRHTAHTVEIGLDAAPHVGGALVR